MLPSDIYSVIFPVRYTLLGISLSFLFPSNILLVKLDDGAREYGHSPSESGAIPYWQFRLTKRMGQDSVWLFHGIEGVRIIVLESGPINNRIRRVVELNSERYSVIARIDDLTFSPSDDVCCAQPHLEKD
jgi:hypothetical protein